MKNVLCGIALAVCSMTFWSGAARADDVCPRPAAQSEVQRPPDIYSQNGKIDVKLHYLTAVDDTGRTLFCFVTPDGVESPTLHVNPGDNIKIELTNLVPTPPGGRTMVVSNDQTVCGSATMNDASVNMHFHGTNTAPRCHSDEVIHTLVNSGESFTYNLRIPPDEPPGLYWYHPHVHGTSSGMLQGGATGAIEVEGIQNIQPAVAGLPERYLVLRDQQNTGDASHGSGLPNVPNWDISVNYVPIDFPAYKPAVIAMQSGQPEFWRVVNAGANTIMDLEVVYDGVPQPLQVVALDGVPTGSKDGKHQGTIVTETDAILPPSARVEFIVAPPGPDVKKAQLITLGIDGGAASDSNPRRPFANITAATAPNRLPRMPEPNGGARKMRFDDLANAPVTQHRDLFFSEYYQAFGHDTEKVDFFITVDGAKETLFDPNEPPAITTTRGAVEEWRIENRTQELHEFHMHQIHFLVTAVNDKHIRKDRQQLYDVFQVPYWSGHPNEPYPSITVKLDFRGPTVGDFVYHCHILDHEDAGMMAIIRVLPDKGARTKQHDADARTQARGRKT